MLFPFPVASPELLAKIDAFSAAAPDDYGSAAGDDRESRHR